MPAFLKLQRLNRRLFQLISGILWILFLIAIYTVFKLYAPSLDANLPAMMKFIMNMVDLKYYLLGFAIFLMLGFSFGYIGRFKDAGISPFIALIPLMLFYGLIVFFMIDLIALMKESNLLLFIAKFKKFAEEPVLVNFQGLFSTSFIQFIAEKKRWIDMGIVLYFLIVISAMVAPSQTVTNRYGNPKVLSVSVLFFSLVGAFIFWVMTIAMFYLGWQFLWLPNLAEYLVDYEQFMQLLNVWLGS